MKNSLTSNLNKLAPADIELTKKRNITDGSLYSKEKQADGKISLIESLNHLDFDVDANFKDVVDFSIYTTSEVTLKDTLGDYYADTAKEKYPLLLYDKAESFIRISDYNKIAKIFYLKTYSLADDEYIVVANYKELSGVRDEGLAYKPKIEINGKEYHPKYLKCMDGFYEMNSSYANLGFLIVPDDAVFDEMIESETLIVNYKANNTEEKKAIEDKVLAMEKNEYIHYTTLEARTRIYIADASIGLGGMVTFIGLYLGIIFLISCVAILALKELSDFLF